MYKAIQEQDKSRATMVADQISELIRTRELRAGDKLPNEFELAKDLGVGRGTIREAVKQLVARNALVIERGRGTFVAKHPGRIEDPLGFNYIENQSKLTEDLLQVRMVVEPWIAGLAAEKATEQDVKIILQKCNEVEGMILRDEPHANADIQFHTAIARATQNLAVPSLIPVINRSVDMFILATGKSLLKETIVTHRAIAEGIANHDPEAARAAMQKHIAYNEERMKKLMKQAEAEHAET